MTETKKENSGLLIGIVLGIIAILIAGALVKYICNEPKQSDPNYKQQLAIEKKQHGNEQAILLNEIEQYRRKLQAANNVKDSIRQREIILTATNTNLLKKLRQTLPKECDTVFVLCDEIINIKDSSYASLFTAFLLADSANILKDSLILSYQAENITDSLRLDVVEKENKKLTRKAKRGKIASWLIGGGLVALFLGTSFVD